MKGWHSPEDMDRQVAAVEESARLLNEEEIKSELLQQALDACEILQKIEGSGARQQRPRKGKV